MKISRTLLFVAVSLSAIAMAQAPEIRKVTFGQGVVANQEAERRAEFDYDMGKRRAQNNTIVNVGRFELNTPGPNNSRVKFVLEAPRELSSNGDNASFAGPGMMIVRTGNNTVRTPVRISVRVEDKWNPTGNGGNGEGENDPQRPRDTMSIRVIPAQPQGGDGGVEPQPIFQFTGKVVRGNLVVVNRPTTGTGGSNP
jgi:hypothetical protein